MDPMGLGARLLALPKRRGLQTGDSLGAGTDETAGYRSSDYHILKAAGLHIDWVGCFQTQTGDGTISPFDFDHSCVGGSTTPDLIGGTGGFAGAWAGGADRSLYNQLQHFMPDFHVHNGLGNGGFDQATTRQHVLDLAQVHRDFAEEPGGKLVPLIIRITGTNRRSGEEGYTDAGWQNRRTGLFEAIRQLEAEDFPIFYAPAAELIERCIRFEARAAKDGVHLNRWAYATVGGPSLYQALGLGSAEAGVRLLEEQGEYTPVVEAISNRSLTWTVNPDFYDPVGQLIVLRKMRVYGPSGAAVTVQRAGGPTVMWESGTLAANQQVEFNGALPITTGEQVTVTPTGSAKFDAIFSIHKVLPIHALEGGI